jgi:hypothetical protein
MPISSYSTFVSVSDVHAIETATGLTMVCSRAERDEIASLLNRAALDLVYSSQDEATAGQQAKFADEAQKRCTDLLDVFGFSAASGFNTEALAQFMRAWSAPVLDAGFDADELDTADSLLKTFRELDGLRRRLQALAAFHKATIQRKSKPDNETALFFLLDQAFKIAFDRNLTITWDDYSGTHTGHGLRFCHAVMKIFKESIAASDLDVTAIQSTLATLATIDDSRIAQRIRTVRTMQPVRPSIVDRLEK